MHGKSLFESGRQYVDSILVHNAQQASYREVYRELCQFFTVGEDSAGAGADGDGADGIGQVLFVGPTFGLDLFYVSVQQEADGLMCVAWSPGANFDEPYAEIIEFVLSKHIGGFHDDEVASSS